MAKNQNAEVQTPNINLIGNGTNIIGDLNVNGDIRIDGILKGSLIGQGRVVIGQSGVVKGKITCQNAEISGSVDGEIFVSEVLSLHSSAKITGNIKISKISIEPGAFFSGNCEMSVQPINNNIEEQEPGQAE